MPEPHANIMVVEDEYIVAKDIQNTLTNLGYTVPAIAASGEEAIKKANEMQPDLILMDIVLKGALDGVETANEIKTQLDIPVVYLTAYADDKTLQRAKITEPYGYLIKPFEERELHSTIEMALFKQSMEKRLKDSEQWLSTTLNSIGEGIIATDEKGEITFINPVAQELIGCEFETVLGKPLKDVFQIIDEDTGLEIEDLVEKVLDKEDVIKFAKNSLLKPLDRPEIPIIESGAQIKDEKNEVNGVVFVFEDITERRVAENAVQESEERYRKLVANFPQPMVVQSGGTLVFINPKAVELLKATSVEELIGKSIFDYIHPDYQDEIKARIHELELGKVSPISIRTKAVRLDGKFIDIDFSATPITYHGQPATQVALKDITESRLAEEVLKESEERYRNLVDHSIDGIAIVQQGIIKFVNPGIEKITGFTASDVVGTHFIEYLHPDEVERVMEIYSRRMEGGKVPDTYETKIKTRSGEIKFAEINAWIDTYDDKPADLIFLRDITDRKLAENAMRESEQKYKNLIEISPDAIVYTDLNGKISMINQQTLKVYGSSTEDEILKKSAFEFIAPEDRDRAASNAQKTLESGGTRNIHYKLHRKDGTPFQGDISTTLVKNSEGVPKGILSVIRDISEAIRIAQALQESELKYRNLVEQSRLGIVITQGMPPTIRFANKGIGKILGFTVEDLNNLTPEDLMNHVHPEDLPKFVEKYTSRLDGKKVTPSTELRCFGKDSELRWLEFYANIIEYKGEPAVQAAFLDVTDRKKAEEAVLESQEKYSKLFHKSNDLIIIHDLEGNIVDVNQKALDKFGYSQSKFLSLNVQDIHPKDVETKSNQAFDRIIKDGYVIFEINFKTNTGEIFPAEVSSSLFKIGDKKVIQGIIRDISSRDKPDAVIRETEQRYRSFVESFQGIAYRANLADWTPVFFHGAVEKITGYTEEDFISGKPSWDQVILPEDMKRIMEPAEKLKKEPNYSMEREYRIKRKDGAIRWVHEMTRNICDDSGKPVLCHGALLDITAQKEAEQLLIEERNRAKLYLDILGHDISNLNQSILTSCEGLLMEFGISKSELDRTQTFFEQAKAISNIISNVRKLTEIREKDDKFEKINVYDYFSNSMDHVKKLHPEKKIKFKHKIPKNNVFTKGNDLLQHVFDNILSNAVKYDPSKNVNVEVLYTPAEDDKFWKFEFKDNGPGISDIMKDKIFSRFDGKEPSVLGLGLGLTIVKEIINRLGGKIWVEDKVKGSTDSGSNFIILLPKEE
jgi:PAS domain S-box-containing protein